MKRKPGSDSSSAVQLTPRIMGTTFEYPQAALSLKLVMTSLPDILSAHHHFPSPQTQRSWACIFVIIVQPCRLVPFGPSELWPLGRRLLVGQWPCQLPSMTFQPDPRSFSRSWIMVSWTMVSWTWFTCHRSSELPFAVLTLIMAHCVFQNFKVCITTPFTMSPSKSGVL